MDALESLIAPAALLAAVVAAVAWLFKVIVLEALRREGHHIRHNLERDSAVALETLRIEASRELEAMRQQYDRDLQIYRTRFERLQDKRVEPLLELYGRLAELASCAQSLQTILEALPDEDIASDVEELRTACDHAQAAYLKALLFLPSTLADRIDQFVTKLSHAETSFYVDSKTSMAHARSSLKDAVALDHGRIVAKLADEFRALLGVENAPVPAP